MEREMVSLIPVLTLETRKVINFFHKAYVELAVPCWKLDHFSVEALQDLLPWQKERRFRKPSQACLRCTAPVHQMDKEMSFSPTVALHSQDLFHALIRSVTVGPAQSVCPQRAAHAGEKFKWLFSCSRLSSFSIIYAPVATTISPSEAGLLV